MRTRIASVITFLAPPVACFADLETSVLGPGEWLPRTAVGFCKFLSLHGRRLEP